MNTAQLAAGAEQALGTAAAISAIAQPAVAAANPEAGVILAVGNAATQYILASQAMHAHGAIDATQYAQDWANATAAVAAAAAKFNAAHRAAAAVVDAAASAAAGAPESAPVTEPATAAPAAVAAPATASAA